MRLRWPIPDMGPGDFILEVVIVVLGVLLALGSEHVVELIRWHQKTGDTTKQLDAEVHSNAVSAYRWLTLHQCLSVQLDAIETDVRAARHSHLLAPVSEYTPPLEVFLTDAWNNSRSLDVADHINPEAMRRYAVLYFFPPQLQIEVVQLHQLAAELEPLIRGEDEVSPAEAGEYQRLIGRIRELQGRIELAETVLLKDGERLGRQLSPGEKRELLRQSRARFGPCAGEPPPARA